MSHYLTKENLFYTLATAAFGWTINQGFELKSYVDYLKIESPECTERNPNMLQLFFGMILIQLCLQYPVQAIAKSLFLSSLPDKFPRGSKIRIEKAEMMSERVYKFFIYAATTGCLFFVLKQSNFLHTYLWGDQADPQYFANYPCQKIPKYLDDIYVIKLAYHTYELVYTLLFQYDRRDFPEYILHHIVTMSLILFSYSVNFLPIGGVIMIIHDLPDCLVCIYKITADVMGPKIQYSAAAAMFLSWIYFRLWFFPYQTIYMYYQQVAHSTHYVISNVFWIIFVFLCFLEILHLFWFHLMIKGIINRLTNKEKNKIFNAKDKYE
eukprot:403341532